MKSLFILIIKENLTMSEQNETVIYTEERVRVSISEWDDGGAWLHLQVLGGTAHAILTKAEAEQLLVGLQQILTKETV
jgi:hypothetical protein